MDEQIIVIPDPGQSPVSIIGGQIIPFTIDNLRIPSTASLDSNFTVEVIVDEQPNPNIPSDGIMPEAIEDHISNTTDNRSGKLQYYSGERSFTPDQDGLRKQKF